MIEIQPVTPHEEEFLRNLLQEKKIRMFSIYDRVGFPLYMMYASIALAFAPLQFRDSLVAASLFGAFEIMVWRSIIAPLIKDAYAKLLTLRMATSFLFIGFIHGALWHVSITAKDIAPVQFIGGGILVGILLLIWGLILSHFNSLIFISGCSIAIINFTVGYLDGLENPTLPAVAIFISGMASSSMLVMRHAQSRRSALLEWRSRQLAQQNDELRLNALEKDLQLARDLRQATKSQLSTLTFHKVHLTFMQKVNDTIGSDWVVAQETTDGRLIVAVADVVNRGVPAAMVLQILQASWVERISNPNFHAGEWLSSLNFTLYRMGHHASHSVTMGVLEILPTGDCQFFAAGCPPLIRTQGTSHDDNNTMIQGMGDILGLRPSVTIIPVQVSIATEQSEGDDILLLGSNGALDWRTRRHSRRLARFVKSVLQHGSTALEARTSDDDQTLVKLQYLVSEGNHRHYL